MTDDRLFNEQDCSDKEAFAYQQGLIEALKIIDDMVDGNTTIQAWNLMAKRAANEIRKLAFDFEP